MPRPVRSEGSLERVWASPTFVCTRGRCANDPPAPALFDHLYTGILVTEEDSTRVDGEDTFPMIHSA